MAAGWICSDSRSGCFSGRQKYAGSDDVILIFQGLESLPGEPNFCPTRICQPEQGRRQIHSIR